jgi:Ca-activated chloride channel family protein
MSVLAISYGDPIRLWFLLGVIALAAIYVVLQWRRQQYAVRFTNMALLDAVAPKRPGWRRHAAAFAFLLAIATLVIAFAKPTHDEKVPRERATVVVAIDTSLSMEANDITPTRIDAVKAAATSFVNQLPPKINLGVVSFDGNARLIVAPTTDRSKARTAISKLELNEGTAIGEAIFTSLDAIKQTVTVDDSGQKIPARIVLMSDGKTTVGRSNDDAIAAAQKAGVPISTIAFGTDHGEITVPESPDPIPVPVDKEALQAIADQTHGSFFTAASAKELQQVYTDIGSSIGFDLEPREITTWFVGGALVFLLATAAMSLAWFSRLP